VIFVIGQIHGSNLKFMASTVLGFLARKNTRPFSQYIKMKGEYMKF